ncbi:MAG TPA: sigma 54-interacting transcriptional regulator [Longimicrobiales bacterium]|nr:sigma 54-interacting transcriptional regulator [Longimicrobiales bacterium]
MSDSALVGVSPEFRAAVELAYRVAAYRSANVLLVGETGTGKELFARAIHNASPDAGEPFVAINCSAIPEALLESELFGHEKGAFTGAHTSKRGLLEIAGGGTVMLDDINELPPSLQPKLLRVLEDRRVRRLGAVQEYEVRCRIIATTNRDLATCVEEGGFRSDLYYRLNVLRIDLPPLRERRGDIEVLAEHFVDVICREHGLPRKKFTVEAMALLESHPWLGNVRELKNTLESAIVLADGPVIRPEHVRLRRRVHVAASQEATSGDHAGARTENGRRGDRTISSRLGAVVVGGPPVVRVPPGGVTLEEVERQLLSETLRMAKNNRSLAARMLGVSRPTVLRMINRHRLS